jgi:hypothetical protein
MYATVHRTASEQYWLAPEHGGAVKTSEAGPKPKQQQGFRVDKRESGWGTHRKFQTSRAAAAQPHHLRLLSLLPPPSAAASPLPQGNPTRLVRTLARSPSRFEITVRIAAATVGGIVFEQKNSPQLPLILVQVRSSPPLAIFPCKATQKFRVIPP